MLVGKKTQITVLWGPCLSGKIRAIIILFQSFSKFQAEARLYEVSSLFTSSKPKVGVKWPIISNYLTTAMTSVVDVHLPLEIDAVSLLINIYHGFASR